MTQNRQRLNTDENPYYEYDKKRIRSYLLRSFLKPEQLEDEDLNNIFDTNHKPNSFILAKNWLYKVISREGEKKVMLFTHKNRLIERTEQAPPLIIDFSVLLDYAGVLTINHWNRGITWQLESDGTTDNFEYLDSEAVPLPFIVYQADCLQWYLAIPKKIRVSLSLYSTNEFAILYLVSHHRTAYQLFVSHPTMFWILVSVAKEKALPEEDFLKLLTSPRKEIMQYCELPETNSAIKLIRKLKFEQFNKTSLISIRALFNIDDHAYLNHIECIQEDAIDLVCRYPELIKTRFIHNINKEKQDFIFISRIDDTIKLAERLDINDIFSRIGKCRSYDEIGTIHDELVFKVNALEYEDIFAADYPEPPIEGSEFIIPIATGEALFREGVEQHHCVSLYHERIVMSDYYVYKILEPERATLGLILNKGYKPKLDQLVLVQNGDASENTKQFVLKWLQK